MQHGVQEAQAALIAAFILSVFLGPVFLIFILTITTQTLWGSGQMSWLVNEAQQYCGQQTIC